MWRRRSTLAAALGATLALLGCGGDDDDPPDYPKSVDGVRACLEDDDRFRDVEPLDSDPSASALSKTEQEAIDAAVGDAPEALSARAGGPTENDDVISEAPVSALRLYFLDSADAAKSAAGRLEPATGRPADKVLNAAEPAGRVLLVHYSFGIGDRPGGVPLDAETVATVERCLRAAGQY
jgi:hypothetical protein